MTHQSMTGFGRQDGETAGISFVWELRSVNGKNLDVRLRLPAGFEHLEQPARKIFASNFSRGNMQAVLHVTSENPSVTLAVNRKALDGLVEAAAEISERTGGEMPGVGELLNVRGIVEPTPEIIDRETAELRDNDLLAGLADAISALAEARRAEGASIVGVLAEQVERMDALRQGIADDPSRTPDAIRERLAEQVARLAGAGEALDPDRLHQEAVLLAAKADLREELDRLDSHVNAARQLLQDDGPAGRKLDFLAQEFNRECNTICSKSNASTVTALGLELKLAIDQFREQLQNLE